MTFGHAIKTCLSKNANFTGRASRSEFWFFYLFFVLVMAATATVDMVVGTYPILYAIAFLGLFLPMLAAEFRRLHDTNRSAWWILISFVPIVGFIVLIVFFCLEGTKGDNRFGSDPLGPDTSTFS